MNLHKDALLGGSMKRPCDATEQIQENNAVAAAEANRLENRPFKN